MSARIHTLPVTQALCFRQHSRFHEATCNLQAGKAAEKAAKKAKKQAKDSGESPVVKVVAEAGRGGSDMPSAAQAAALLAASAEQVKQAAQKWPKRDAQVCCRPQVAAAPACTVASINLILPSPGRGGWSLAANAELRHTPVCCRPQLAACVAAKLAKL